MTRVRIEARCGWMALLPRLHITPGTSGYDEAVRLLPELDRVLARELKPRGCYALCPRGMVHTGLPELDGSPYQMVGLVTGAPEISAAVSRRMERGELLAGYLLDAASTDVLFQAAEQVYCQMGAAPELLADGLVPARRYFPGDGELPLSMLEHLLACLRGAPEAEGVTLTDERMLRPEKSVLYLCGTRRAASGPAPDGHSCTRCSRLDCPYRRAERENGRDRLCTQ